MSTMPETASEVILGVDTHEREHVAALIDELGRLLATRSFPATAGGFELLLAWARGHGSLRRAGVEGTGSFGAGIARFLDAQGVEVLEVTRPNRRGRRQLGKSDTIDAEAAARMVLAGEAAATPKSRDGIVESIRVLQLARRSAITARTQAGQQIRSLVITAPAELNNRLAGLTTADQVARCLRLRPASGQDADAATQRALRSLAKRWQQLDREIGELESELHTLTRAAVPRLLAEPGIGPDSAAKLLAIASDNPDRVRSDAALAALCGASPVEASSGKTKRHRLNKGGDRQGNNALRTIANNRLIHHPETRAYAARRSAQGLSRKEILRCLKRNLARRLYPLLLADLRDATMRDHCRTPRIFGATPSGHDSRSIGHRDRGLTPTASAPRAAPALPKPPVEERQHHAPRTTHLDRRPYRHPHPPAARRPSAAAGDLSFRHSHALERVVHLR